MHRSTTDDPIPLPSTAMRRVSALVARVAPTDATVLVTGESGVGKEHVARAVHDQSRRRRGPLVAVSCAELADTLLETELFGHARGAFTGALQDRPGVFEAADGGTLFLDEIGDISTALQVRLLRVLQAREVRRVGEVRVRPIDVRIVTATHRDLTAEVARGRFRQDLYYRLRVVEVHVPPLRERPGDIDVLVDALLARIAGRMERRIDGCSDHARLALMAHDWPGNVRELAHALEYACVAADGPLVEVRDLPDSARRGVAGRPPDRPLLTLHDAACDYVRLVVDRHQGNRRRAAEELQISMPTLNRKLAAALKRNFDRQTHA
jgi:transcriptional regulator with PAS, ATPase and Fis domain